MLFGDVIVDISAGNLDRVFQYSIPEKFLKDIEVGMEVTIPFGKGNRQIKGFIVNLTKTPGYDINKIKPITDIVSHELVVESQMIKLAWWIKQMYGGTMIGALKTVLMTKKQIKAVENKSYFLAVDEEKARQILKELQSDKRQKSRALIVEELLNKGRLSKDEIKSVLGISKGPVEYLLNQGIIKEDIETVYRKPIGQNPQGEKNAALLLNEEQLKAVREIEEDTAHEVHLLYGITGSGKTEVYMELIADVIKSGRQVIVLIPEISLTYQTVQRFYSRFGDRISIMNSKLSAGEKYDQYLRAKRGEIDIMIGPRSALFTPFAKLGMIIIDEEHDGAYKSEKTPKYHAREVALARARMSGAKVVLGSATPSIVTYKKAVDGEIGYHRLTQRAKDQSRLSKVELVDLREEFKLRNKSIFSQKLKGMIAKRLSRGEQVILFLNRRGYAGFVSCRSCGHVLKCPHCDVGMTYHNKGILKCHYCGYQMMSPKQCPSCGSKYIAAFGTGTQKVEQMVSDEFPEARVLRLDRDVVSKKHSMENILEDFRNHKADILVGTQMIVKGHDFPNVTLVGILAADLSMFSGDYMAAERTFQLLTQAAGRAGRDALAGEVVIQTYNPDHYSIVCAGEQDYESFFEQELMFRRIMRYPPFVHMLVVLVESPNESVAEADISQMKQILDSQIKEAGLSGYELIGPANAYVAKGKDVYRKVLYIKHQEITKLVQIRRYLEQHYDAQYDLDPMMMY